MIVWFWQRASLVRYGGLSDFARESLYLSGLDLLLCVVELVVDGPEGNRL